MKAILATVAILLAAATSGAVTWHVAKDGSGDFAVIQDAVDAASDGDTIWIHAGRYDELIQEFPAFGEGNSFRCDTHVAITKDNLTLRGDGPDLTIIGPSEMPPQPSYEYHGITATYAHASNLTVEDLRVEHVKRGVYAATDESTVERCRFYGIAQFSVYSYLQSDAVVRDCEFLDLGYGVFTYDVTGITIESCTFDESHVGVNFVRTSNAVMESCTIVGGVVGIEFEQGSSGVVNGCQVTGYENYGLALLSGSIVDFSDCEISGGAGGLVVLDHGSAATGSNSLFSDHSYATVELGFGQLVLNQSELINGGGYSVLCYGSSIEPYHVDMINNYWGTDDAEQIAEWIWDAMDDPEVMCTVDYIPFQGPVAVEFRSLSAVKSLFRGDTK